jgi:hypothetical protein
VIHTESELIDHLSIASGCKLANCALRHSTFPPSTTRLTACLQSTERFSQYNPAKTNLLRVDYGDSVWPVNHTAGNNKLSVATVLPHMILITAITRYSPLTLSADRLHRGLQRAR